MSDRTTRDWLKGFIQLYKELPCLWQRHKHYTSRERRDAAYQKLIDKYREVDPKASRDTVTKKINSLRTVYKKELAKVRQSEVMAVCEDDIYVPSLWYYPLIDFLREEILSRQDSQGETRPAAESLEDDPPASVVVCEIGPMGDSNDEEYCKSLYSPGDSEFSSSASSLVRPVNPLTKRSASSSSQEYISKKTRLELASAIHQKHTVNADDTFERKQRHTANAEVEITRFHKHIGDTEVILDRSRDHVPVEDLFDRYGKHIADRLPLIKQNQIKFVQKLVGDVLFEADLESLDESWRAVQTVKKEVS